MNNLKKLFISTPVVVLMLLLFTVVAHAESNRTGTATGDGLNVRKAPDIYSAVVTQLSKGTNVKVVDDAQGWYKITYGDITGWVSGDFLTVKDNALGSGTITGNEVNVRAEPSTEATVMTKLQKGQTAEYFSRSGDWYKIKLADGQFGWVFRDYYLVRNEQASRGAAQEAAAAAESVSEKVSDKANEIVAYAKKFLGVKYSYGGMSPKGFDCSGLTTYVFKNFGINLDRSSSAQATKGTAVKKADLKVADLVFFTSPGRPSSVGHVGIYVGGGKFIHASSSRSSYKVIISDLTTGNYASRYLSARRYLN